MVLRLYQDGTLEYINCGHVYPSMCSEAGVSRLDQTNLPVGLFNDAKYSIDLTTLRPGSGLILVSDGITEAEERGAISLVTNGLTLPPFAPTCKEFLSG
jgi:phosphoserine phosphatase RsbU/P